MGTAYFRKADVLRFSSEAGSGSIYTGSGIASGAASSGRWDPSELLLCSYAIVWTENKWSEYHNILFTVLTTKPALPEWPVEDRRLGRISIPVRPDVSLHEEIIAGVGAQRVQYLTAEPLPCAPGSRDTVRRHCLPRPVCMDFFFRSSLVSVMRPDTSPRPMNCLRIGRTSAMFLTDDLMKLSTMRHDMLEVERDRRYVQTRAIRCAIRRRHSRRGSVPAECQSWLCCRRTPESKASDRERTAMHWARSN